MLVPVIGRQGAEDHLDILDLGQVIGQAAARHGGAVAAFTRLGVAPVDHAVAREIRAQDHVQQSALSPGRDGGQAGDGGADRALGRDHAQAAGLLRHQPAPVRQQRQAPRMLQPLGHDLMPHGQRGADRGRAGLAVEGWGLFGVVGRAGLDRGARGGGVLRPVLSIGAAGGGKHQDGGGGGEEGGTHGGS
ncbi:hypothetical protein D3C80_1359670 [compost metagenome]